MFFLFSVLCTLLELRGDPELAWVHFEKTRPPSGDVSVNIHPHAAGKASSMPRSWAHTSVHRYTVDIDSWGDYCVCKSTAMKTIHLDTNVRVGLSTVFLLCVCLS